MPSNTGDKKANQTTTPVADDRLVIESRGTEGIENRLGREYENSERLEDGTALSLEERLTMIETMWEQEILPKPPQLPGWHCCWLSTTNQTDSIHSRMRIGYRPVMASEVPGFAQYAVNGGELDGHIACNEMILFKVEEEIYQAIMRLVHHNKPLEIEVAIREQLDKQTPKDKQGRNLVETIGFDVLGKSVRPPTSFE